MHITQPAPHITPPVAAQNGDFITKEELNAIAAEEWMDMIRKELGDDMPATIGEIREMAREAALKHAAPVVRISDADIEAIARRVAVILRETGTAQTGN